MRIDWFADLASPVVPIASPSTGNAANRGALRSSPVSPGVPGPERCVQRQEPVARPGHDGLPTEELAPPAPRLVVEYQLADARPGAWLVLLGAPGETYESAADGLRRRYGDRLLDVRPHKGVKR